MLSRSLILLALAVIPLFADAQDRCAAQFQAEKVRIEREASQNLPPKGDRAAEVIWSKNLHLALELAGKNAERCTRESTPPAAPAVLAKEQECIAGLLRRADELALKYKDRTLTTSEQVAHRAEIDRLVDDRMKYQARQKR